MIRVIHVDETCRLMAVDAFCEVAEQESVLDVELVHRPPSCCRQVKHNPDSHRLTTGEIVWWKSTPGRCENPRTTHRALQRSRLPPGCSLFLNNHLPVMMLACAGRGTSVHVPLLFSASNSACIAASHSGSRSAACTDVGGSDGAGVVATCAYLGLGMRIPSCASVTIGCQGCCSSGVPRVRDSTLRWELVMCPVSMSRWALAMWPR